MTKKSFVAALFMAISVGPLLAVTAHAQYVPPTPSSSAVAAAVAAAGAAAGAGSGQTFVVNPDGSVQTDASGKPVLQRNSQSSANGDLQFFQAATGTQGVSPLSSPSGGAGVASVAVNGFTDFKCVPSMHYRTSAAGVFLLISACDATSGATATACFNAQNGGPCYSASDYTAPFTIPVGGYTTVNSVQIGMACNSQGTCRVTVKNSGTFGGSADSLKQQTQDAAANAAPDSNIGLIRQATTGSTAAATTASTADMLKGCFGGTAQNGVYGCAGSENTVTVTSSQTSASCNGPKTCLKWAESPPSTKTCTQVLPITSQETTYVYGNYATCTISDDTSSGSSVVTSSCGANGTVGMTLVGQTSPYCTKYVKNSAGAQVCVVMQHTEYYVNTSAGKITSQTAQPSPVSGACDNGANSTSSTTSCPAGSWFGRTLSLSSCQLPYTDSSTGQLANPPQYMDLDYSSKPGCGFCLNPTENTTCQGTAATAQPADTCSTSDLSGCTLVSSSPQETLGPVVVSQTNTYSCKNPNPVCAQWSSGGDNNCLDSGVGAGLAPAVVNSGADGSMNAAMVGAAVIDSTAQGMNNMTQDQKVPLIFSGKNLKCAQPNGLAGSITSKSCCDINLQRPKAGNVVQSGCSMENAELAAARRSNYATYVGSYCSSCLKVFGHCVKCLVTTNSYCVFPGILPRLVQEQGRPQLAQMVAATGGTSKSAPMSFKFYDAGGGSWSPATTVNGVTFSAWQWPSYCSDLQAAGQHMMSSPGSAPCPSSLKTYVAACSSPSGCGDLPSFPNGPSSGTWDLAAVDPLNNVTTAVNRDGVVTGACSPQDLSCAYTASAWPVGGGGRAIVSKDLSWPLFSTQQPVSDTTSPGIYVMNNMGDLMFKGYSTPGTAGAGASLPATVRMDYSSDGGQTWQSYSLPTQSIKNSQVTLPGSSITVSGGCDSTLNTCDYRVVGTQTVTAKPWGSAQNPDCSGFTAGQLAVLDFSKMDLSEFVNYVMSKVQGNVSASTSSLASVAAQQAQDYYNIMSNSPEGSSLSQTQPSVYSPNFARIIPAQGFGPFLSKLDVSGFWPEPTGDPTKDKDIVTSVTVNWDDCSPPQVLNPISAGQGTGFQATHTFPAPDQLTCKGSPHANYTHNVVITANSTLTGTHTVTVQVENAWATYPGANSNNAFVPQSKTANPSSQ
jgi:hypothetical protein